MNPLAVVTSGTRGIGKATVEMFLANGYDVVTGSRNAGNIQQLDDESRPLRKETALYLHQSDLSVPDGIASFLGFVRGLGRPVDVLVNNTGIFIPGSVHNEPEGALERTIAVNLYSAYHVTRGLLPSMMERKSGHIFTLCSIASIKAYPNGGAYSISKFALYGMTKALREELKPFNIRVTALLPGATLTDSWAGTDLPSERFMKPEDIAEAIRCACMLSPGAVIEDLILRPLLGDI